MIPLRQTIALAGFFVLAAGAPGALATSGPGCYQVVNVESWDVLNLRSRASAKSAIVPAGLLLAAERVEIGPGEDAGVVAVVEDDAHGVIADRLEPADGDVLLAADGDALLGRMALHLGRWRQDPEHLSAERVALVSEGHGQDAPVPGPTA